MVYYQESAKTAQSIIFTVGVVSRTRFIFYRVHLWFTVEGDPGPVGRERSTEVDIVFRSSRKSEYVMAYSVR